MSTPRSRKQKGKDLENYIADQFISKGLDKRARGDGASGAGNREKADIVTSVQIFGRNLGIEAKNWKKASVQSWWKQAQKLEVLGREPVVAYKLFGESLEETKVIIYLDTFLDMIRSCLSSKTADKVLNNDSQEIYDIVYQAKIIKEKCNIIIKQAKNSK